MSAIYPPGEAGGSDEGYKLVDPVQNISATFPPTYIVHGLADTMVTIDVSRELYKRLSEAGVPCGMTEVPGEEHTFAMMMKVGSKTWWLQREGFDFLEKYIGKGPL
jgi:acetyl esterase/lipase